VSSGSAPPADALSALLARTLPPAGAVGALHRLSGGASRETWSFDAGSRPLVLRRDPPGGPDPAAMAREAECFRAAAEAGVPVPQLLAAGDGSDGIGSPYLLMERLDGESLPQRLLRDERWAPVRRRLAHELGSVLARIHAVDLGRVPSLERTPDRLAALRAQHDAFGEPRPATELALRWLADHRPAPVADAFVHGDYRNGNLIIDDNGVRAVLDWELAHVGDPREDLGWLCAKAWRFGSANPVGGFGSREELFAGYERVAGARPDPAAVHWWEVFACVHWAVICRIQVERQLSGAEQTVEMAIVGRRVAEAEFDALLALGLAEPVTVDDLLLQPAPPADPVLQARPTTDELLAAVAGYLRTEHAPSDPRDAYLARVAANAVAIVRRSLREGPADIAYRERLGAIGCVDDAALAGGIRSGRLAGDDPGVVAAVVAGVVAQLAVANPRYLAQPG
jgi:aminoglycoside phosphotransferase (APT) family kinase protein